VQLLVDRNAAAGAIVERSRAQGVVVGGGDDGCAWNTCPKCPTSSSATSS
jgi:hypothetical protein